MCRGKPVMMWFCWVGLGDSWESAFLTIFTWCWCLLVLTPWVAKVSGRLFWLQVTEIQCELVKPRRGVCYEDSGVSHKAKYRIKNVPLEELEPKETPLVSCHCFFLARTSLLHSPSIPSFLTFPSILVRAKAAFPTVLWIPPLLLPWFPALVRWYTSSSNFLRKWAKEVKCYLLI